MDQTDTVIATIKQGSGPISDIKFLVDTNRKNLDDTLHQVQTAVERVTEGGQQLTTHCAEIQQFRTVSSATSLHS